MQYSIFVKKIDKVIINVHFPNNSMLL